MLWGFFCFFFFLFSFSQLEPELGYILPGFTCLFLVLLLTENTSMNPGKVFSAKSGWDAPLTKVTMIAGSSVLHHSGVHPLSRKESYCPEQGKSWMCPSPESKTKAKGHQTTDVLG